MGCCYAQMASIETLSASSILEGLCTFLRLHLHSTDILQRGSLPHRVLR